MSRARPNRRGLARFGAKPRTAAIPTRQRKTRLSSHPPLTAPAAAATASAMRSRTGTLLAAYTAAVFLSAFLLFLVQPLFGKMVLPLLGGSPAVWNTCMLFFQAALLGGYLYAHVSSSRLTVRRQATVHLAALALAALALPVSLRSAAPEGGAAPIPWLLGADGDHRGRAVPGAERHGSHPAALVLAQRPRAGGGSVPPVRRQQPGERAGPDRVSAADGAADAPGRPERRVDGRLRRAGPADRRVRRAGVEDRGFTGFRRRGEFAGSGRSGPCGGCSRSGGYGRYGGFGRFCRRFRCHR